MSVEDIIFLMRKDKVGFINSNCCDVCKIDTQLQVHTLRIEHGSVEIPSFSSHVILQLANGGEKRNLISSNDHVIFLL